MFTTLLFNGEIGSRSWYHIPFYNMISLFFEKYTFNNYFKYFTPVLCYEMAYKKLVNLLIKSILRLPLLIVRRNIFWSRIATPWKGRPQHNGKNVFMLMFCLLCLLCWAPPASPLKMLSVVILDAIILNDLMSLFARKLSLGGAWKNPRF
jgi:hypothetical protein